MYTPAIEFSMDGGKTWTSFETPGTNRERWVYWNFEYIPAASGSYELCVRARTETGRTSALTAKLKFRVYNKGMPA